MCHMVYNRVKNVPRVLIGCVPINELEIRLDLYRVGGIDTICTHERVMCHEFLTSLPPRREGKLLRSSL